MESSNESSNLTVEAVREARNCLAQAYTGGFLFRDIMNCRSKLFVLHGFMKQFATDNLEYSKKYSEITNRILKMEDNMNKQKLDFDNQGVKVQYIELFQSWFLLELDVFINTQVNSEKIGG